MTWYHKLELHFSNYFNNYITVSYSIQSSAFLLLNENTYFDNIHYCIIFYCLPLFGEDL